MQMLFSDRMLKFLAEWSQGKVEMDGEVACPELTVPCFPTNPVIKLNGEYYRRIDGAFAQSNLLPLHEKRRRRREYMRRYRKINRVERHKDKVRS